MCCAALVDQSLVQVDDSHGDELTRYRLLEPIRQYAAKLLAVSVDSNAVRNRHLEFFARLSEMAEPELHGRLQVRWLNILERELDNLRAALGWSLDAGDRDNGLRLAAALWYFWDTRGYGVEGHAWLVRMLETCPDGRARLKSAAMNAAGNLATDLTEGQNWFEQSLALNREMGDRTGMFFSSSQSRDGRVSTWRVRPRRGAV